jgi:hypothetical protein
MPGPESIFEQALDMVRQLTSEEGIRRRKKRVRRLVMRLLKLFALMMLSTTVIVVGMISGGFLLGPRGIEGLLALPVLLFSTWSAILYFGLRSRPAPRALPSSADIKQLPAQTEDWLEAQRFGLPADARLTLDRILQRLDALTPQVQALDPQSPGAHEVRRLIGEELPELVRGYQRVPRAMKDKPTHGGKSPDRQIVEGLSTIDEELERVQAQLAAEDMRALATQQRYLEMKYRRDKP